MEFLRVVVRDLEGTERKKIQAFEGHAVKNMSLYISLAHFSGVFGRGAQGSNGWA